MKDLYYCVLLLLSASLFSCEQTEIDGLSNDIIEFDSKTAKFDANGGSKTINSKGDWWWICKNIDLQDSTIFIGNSKDLKVEMGKMKDWDNPNVIYDEGANMEIRKIEGPWFSITKNTNKSLIIETRPNTTNTERTLAFTIQAGNYFDYITVHQSANTN